MSSSRRYDDYRDIETAEHVPGVRGGERGRPRGWSWQKIHAKSRDNARTPVQWDDSENAGFTSGTPWIEVNPNYSADQCRSRHWPTPNRFSHYYQKLIRLRKENPVIVYGRYDLILEAHGEIYAFTRTLEDDRLLVILNFTARRAGLRAAELGFSSSTRNSDDRQLRGRSGRRYRAADAAAL